MTKLLILLVISMFLTSCGGYVYYNPKTKNYERIIPVKRYKYIDVPVYRQRPIYYDNRCSSRYYNNLTRRYY